MKPFSAQIPWVIVNQRTAGTGAMGVLAEFEVMCRVCGAQSTVYGAEMVTGFATAHQAHRAAPGHIGVGDMVASVAGPIARAMGQQPCTPCEARRHALNRFRLPFSR